MHKRDRFSSAVLIFVINGLFFLNASSALTREYVEAFCIFCAGLLILSSRSKAVYVLFFMFVFVAIIKAFFYNSLFIGLYDFAALPLLIYYIRSREGCNINSIRVCVRVIALVQFVAGLYCYYFNFTVDGGRIGGLFPSSMHYGFATVGLAVSNYLVFDKKEKIYVGVILVLSALMSGSRAASFCTCAFLLISFAESFGVLRASILCLASVVCIGAVFPGLRAFGFNEYSDTGRLQSYYDWFERVDVGMLIFGSARYFLGSVGRFANHDSLVTESSILTFIEAYGLIIGGVFIVAPLSSFLKVLVIGPVKITVTAFVFYLVAFVSPFFETPSILLLNTLLIKCSLDSMLKKYFSQAST